MLLILVMILLLIPVQDNIMWLKLFAFNTFLHCIYKLINLLDHGYFNSLAHQLIKNLGYLVDIDLAKDLLLLHPPPPPTFLKKQTGFVSSCTLLNNHFDLVSGTLIL